MPQTQIKKHKQTIKNVYKRSPTLDTVYMIEKTIEKYSGEYNKTQIWRELPRKVMWQTYKLVINYLGSINKIAVGRKGILVYIWNPKIVEKYLEMRNVDYE